MHAIHSHSFFRGCAIACILFLAGEAAGQTVSVNQLLAPAKAQQELEKSGRAYAKRDTAGAMQHVNRALALHPAYAKALAWRGILESEDQSRLQEACADLEAAVQQDPNFAFGFSALGTIYNSLARWDDARQVLERALRLQPSLWQPHYELARTDAAQRKFESALRHLDTMISLGGDSGQAAELKAMIDRGRR
jgi:tetratricopeptide (TPR) repeat protein